LPHTGPPELEDDEELLSPEDDELLESLESLEDVPSGSTEVELLVSPELLVPVLSRPVVVVSPTVVGVTVTPVVSSPVDVDSESGVAGMSSAHASKGQVRSKKPSLVRFIRRASLRGCLSPVRCELGKHFRYGSAPPAR
jgi:hypothetical protein